MRVRVIGFWLLVSLLPLLLCFFPSPLLSATANHTYDNLNRLVQTVYDTGAKVTTIDYTYDAAGNMLRFSVSANYLLGDVDDSKAVDLADAVLCLQLLSGTPPYVEVHQGADIDGDNKLGNVELIYILRAVAGLE